VLVPTLRDAALRAAPQGEVLVGSTIGREMRAEAQAMVNEIEESLALLRRRL
jgi:hypothetical protein